MRKLIVCLVAPPCSHPLHSRLGRDASGARREAARQERGAEGIAVRARDRESELKSGSGAGVLDVRPRRSLEAALAHIHKGRAGVSGPVFIPLGKTYKAKGCVAAPKKSIDAVESNPNGFYVNVHNTKYPNGIVRGQLVAGMVHM